MSDPGQPQPEDAIAIEEVKALFRWAFQTPLPRRIYRLALKHVAAKTRAHRLRIAQALHDQLQADDPEHDKISCWCCCGDCNLDMAFVLDGEKEKPE